MTAGPDHQDSMALMEKCRWWWRYHTQTQKGRYEVCHFLQWLLFMGVCTACVEAVLLWLGV